MRAMTAARSARVTVRLDPTAHELARQAARAAGLSLSAYAARALRAQAAADTSQEPSGPGEPPVPQPQEAAGAPPAVPRLCLPRPT
jgi:hypothetical protein